MLRDAKEREAIKYANHEKEQIRLCLRASQKVGEGRKQAGQEDESERELEEEDDDKKENK